MPIINLKGGLGNQMFQYAFGRSLSIKCNQDLIINTEFYQRKKIQILIKAFLKCIFYLFKYGNFIKGIKEAKQNKRKYDLKYFKLEKNIKKINKNKTIKTKEEALEFKFDEKIMTCDSLAYSGYFNNEKYFINIKDIIKKDFELLPKYENQLPKDLIDKILKSASISVHVRRGDYISSKQINAFHGTCDIEYYNLAINTILHKIESPVFFIFSDDISWCKKNLYMLKNKNVIFINGLKNYQDLTLMSRCKHNIIANSTFSWWAAWLNNNIEKIVIAPKNWVSNKKVDTKDVIPQDWIKI